MLGLVLVLQLAGAPAGPPPPAGDSVYATPRLRVLVARAAAANRAVPAGFLAYRAHVESELSLLVRDSLGRETAGEIEQLAALADWRRDGAYALHVLGYRARNEGMPYSALSFVGGYTVPWLYGDRLRLGIEPPPGRRRRPARDSLVFVHPLARDRDRYYHFEGGDTVAVLHIRGRTIPLVHVAVRPRYRRGEPFGAFEGDIELDAGRMQIVRMRGQLVRVDRPPHGRPLGSKVPGAIGVAYIDFRNAEVGGRYWLPAFQRTEIQGAVGLLGDVRAVFRLVSTFRDYRVWDAAGRDSASAPAAGPPAPVPESSEAVVDTLSRGPAWPDVAADTSAPGPPPPDAAAGTLEDAGPHAQLTYAPRDSLDGFAAWQEPLGAATAGVQADDFADLAPDAWRPTGPPRLELLPHALGEVFRFNRVEGLYLGLSGTVRLRDRFPGLSAGLFGGVATAERTLRGGVRIGLRRQSWLLDLRAERALASTNDFTPPLADDPGFGALFASVDRNDYVDRRTAALSVTRVLGSVDRALATLELGVGRDRSERQRIGRGIFLTDAGRFGPNRGALDGRYARAVAELELHPGISGASVQPGVGARLHLEAARGTLAWQRLELAIAARQPLGRLWLGLEANAGLIGARTIPPQQLFELGGAATLPGYTFKQFAGDRAALFRASLEYRLPLLRRPVRALRGLYLPGIAPGLLLSAQGGWAELSSPAARLAAQRLGSLDAAPVSTGTGGVRATAGVGLTVFSGLLHAGVARPIDRPARWRYVVGTGGAF